jgi:CO/xanthine dehydrogenase FAD-binding subunit
MKADQVLSNEPGNPDGWWSIDANLSLQQLLDEPGCPPLMRHTLSRELSWQERNRRQIQRALRSPRVAPRWSAALLALGATATTEGEDSSAHQSVEALLEIKRAVNITRLHVPIAGLSWGEARVGRTPADEPIVAAVAAVATTHGIVSQARVALTGVWPKPVGLAKAPAKLIGERLTQDQILSIAAEMEGEVEPEGDFRGSEEYRRAMAVVLTRRALEQCLRKETGNE